MVAPDGYILAINGPYFSDARNNDASILNHELQNDVNGVRAWFQEGDIVVVDRGYHMTPLLARGQHQLSTADANTARLITKTRWIVESRNGHFKSIFKFFKGAMSITHAVNLRDFYCIGGALINRFHPLINMPGTVELARQMLEKSQEVNVVQARVETENLRLRNSNWVLLNHIHVPEFPRLDLEYLKDLTVIYHVELSAGYIQDKLQREEINIIEIDEFVEELNFLRFRIYSRFRNATKYMLWVVYNNEDNLEGSPILGYYCTCKSGTRTLGICAHVASVLWFLGYARYNPNMHYPATTLLNCITEAANRLPPENIDRGPEIVEN